MQNADVKAIPPNREIFPECTFLLSILSYKFFLLENFITSGTKIKEIRKDDKIAIKYIVFIT